jgi:acetyltransferase-like isoleucine patch superfamily enzyme
MLYIFGAGGGAKELLESRVSFSSQKITFIEDSPSSDSFLDWPVISTGDFDFMDIDPEFDFGFISCSDVYFKERIDKRFPSMRWASFVCAGCDFLLKDKGFGNWFGFGSHIPSDLKAGRHVRVNYNGVFGHDCEVGDYSFIGINASVCATTKIGKGVYVGSGSTIINKDLKIGDWSVIGAGAVVTKDVPEGALVVGVPAKVVGNAKTG